MTGVGPNPNRKTDLQWMKSQDFIGSNSTQILQINNRTVSVKKGLPGTVFFSVWLHVTSSTHIRSARALVATEMPGDPTDVVFGDTETRSAATASKPMGIISSSQEEIRSMRRQDYEPRASTLHEMKAASAVWASSLYVVWVGEVPGQGNSKAKTQEQNGKQYTSNLEGWNCACALECTRVSSAGT